MQPPQLHEYSDAIFIQAFPRECTEAFLEGHRRAFDFFGGVPTRISYDNSKIAVAAIMGSRERKVTREFQRLKSHHLFVDHFCLVRRPNEKGHVERLVDFSRSNFLVTVPRVDSLEVLNVRLADDCQKDLQRQLRGKAASRRRLHSWKSIPHHRPALQLRLNRFHTLQIHQRRQARLQHQPHQVRLFDGQFAERLQHVVRTHQNSNCFLHVGPTSGVHRTPFLPSPPVTQLNCNGLPEVVGQDVHLPDSVSGFGSQRDR